MWSTKTSSIISDFAFADDGPLPGTYPPPAGGSGDPNNNFAPGNASQANGPAPAGVPLPGNFSPNSLGAPVGAPTPNNYATPGSIGIPRGSYPALTPAAPASPALPLAPAMPANQLAPPNTPSQAPPTTAPPAATPDLTATLEDYTDKLRLAPGLTMLFPIQNGCDRNGRPLPPYSMAVQIEKRSNDCAFSYKWTMSELSATGVRAVDDASKKTSRKVSLFYKPGEQCTLVGYTNAIRISDAMFRDIKNGTSSPIELDGPFGQATRHAQSIPLPQHIAKTAEENFAIQVDEKKVKVRTIKVVGDNPPGTLGVNNKGGWTYWILDNANFPMILKGSGPFNWEPPIINSNGTISNGDNGGVGTREGKRIVKDLKKNGIATTNAILFDFDSDKLKPSATPILNEVCAYLRSSPSVKVAVQGHCDNVGGVDYNMNLSRRRAGSVRQYMVNNGIVAGRLESEGYGFTKPVATNKTAAGRAKNRRVVFKVTAK